MAQLDTSPALAPVSKVILAVDSENAYIAGDDTGRTIEVTCPYGTQEMANNILAALSSYAYTPAIAQDAILDPAAEIGDGLTMGGVYTVLAQSTMTFDGLMTSDAGAPGQAEQESEYKYQSPVIADINWQLAQTRSLISKTSEEILLQVENELEGLSASFSVQLNSITQQITGINGEITQLSTKLDSITLSVTNGETSSIIELKAGEAVISSQNITFDGFVTFAGLSGGTTTIDGACIKTGTISADRLELTGEITWSDLASDAQNQVTNAQNLASSAYGTAVSAQTSANTANSQLSAWTYPGTTLINGNMLQTGTVMASKLLGGTVGLLASNQTVVGSLDIAYTTTGIGLGMTSNYGGMQLKAAGGNVYVESGYGPYLQLGQGAGIGKGVCQLGGGPLVLDSNSFGTTLPSSGVYGQVFFLLG